MNEYKYLAKNIGLLSLSSFATKFLSFFLVPLYTNVLSTSEYGIYDLFNTTISVLLPILTLNIHESVMRFTLEKNYRQGAIFSVGVRYIFLANLIVVLGLITNYIFGFNLIVKRYIIFFFLMFFVQSLSGIILANIRGNGWITDLSISSVIASVGIIGFNMLFLIVFKAGLIGYFLANILGALLQCLYLFVKADIRHNLYLKQKFVKEKKAMLDYCRPTVINSIAWWVNNTSDRYVIVFFRGLAEGGIYSVALKIPMILNVFQSIFNQAWTLSAVREFDSEDRNGFFSSTYRAYNCLMVVICSIIILVDKFLSRILYAKDFFIAWKFVPWLTIAIVFGALSGYIGGFFTALKKSEYYALSSVFGAFLNVLINLILTPLLGALGAAIATFICYFVVWITRYRHSRHFIKFKVNLIRDVISYIVLIVQAVFVLIIHDILLLYSIEIVLFLLIIALYITDISKISNKIFLIIKNKLKEGKK